MSEPAAPLNDRGTDRYVLTIDLRDDPAGIEAYRTHHRQVWPEVVRSLQNAGVRELDLHSVFTRHASSHPRVTEWQRLMASFQQPAPGALPGDAGRAWSRFTIWSTVPLDAVPSADAVSGPGRRG